MCVITATEKGKSMQHFGTSTFGPCLCGICRLVCQTRLTDATQNPPAFLPGKYHTAVTPVLRACHSRSMVAQKAITTPKWWNSNLSQEQWTPECPVSLQDASEKDKGIIGSSQAQFRPMSWDEVKNLIGKCPES